MRAHASTRFYGRLSRVRLYGSFEKLESRYRESRSSRLCGGGEGRREGVRMVCICIAIVELGRREIEVDADVEVNPMT